MKKIMLVLVVTLVFLLTSCSPTVSINLIKSNDNIEVYDHHVVKSCEITIDDSTYSMKIAANNVDSDTVGTYTIDYEYEFDGDVYLCTRYVFVTDQTAPTVVLNPGIDTVQVGSQWIDTGVTVTDNYYTTGFTVEIENDVNSSQIGEYVVSYVVTDGSGNITTVERIIHVVE